MHLRTSSNLDIMRPTHSFLLFFNLSLVIILAPENIIIAFNSSLTMTTTSLFVEFSFAHHYRSSGFSYLGLGFTICRYTLCVCTDNSLATTSPKLNYAYLYRCALHPTKRWPNDTVVIVHTSNTPDDATCACAAASAAYYHRCHTKCIRNENPLHSFCHGIPTNPFVSSSLRWCLALSVVPFVESRARNNYKNRNENTIRIMSHNTIAIRTKSAENRGWMYFVFAVPSGKSEKKNWECDRREMRYKTLECQTHVEYHFVERWREEGAESERRKDEIAMMVIS